MCPLNRRSLFINLWEYESSIMTFKIIDKMLTSYNDFQLGYDKSRSGIDGHCFRILDESVLNVVAFVDRKSKAGK